MKILEDVIKAYECKKSIEDKCNKCPYFYKCDDKYHCECEARDNDALHYLKEYKINLTDHILIKERLKFLQDLWKEENEPLTWDELKTMEGKPVWIENKYHNPEADYKYWTIIKYFDSNEGGDMVFTGTGFYYKDLLGIDWKAYKKEKK